MRGHSTDTHKSLPKHPAQHSLVWVRENGYRALDYEAMVQRDGELFVLADNDPVARLDLSAEGLEFILDCLPDGDEFTNEIQYLRDLCKRKVEDEAWEKRTT